MKNLAQLIEQAVLDRPEATFGTFNENDRLDGVVERARSVAAAFGDAGLRRGDTVAVLGSNSSSYLVTWMASQLVGLKTALINPSYPDELLGAMLDRLAPKAIFWAGREAGALASRLEGQFDLKEAWLSRVTALRAIPQVGDAGAGFDGVDADGAEVSAYLHTSGTTGMPKFCALSHTYFLRLGRYIVDTLGLSRLDTVLSPLPMFHINPLGYGVVGSLVARASLLSMERFGADGFWSNVKNHDVSAMILHLPPANLLLSKTTPEQAQGHKVRIGFLCGPAFMKRFDVPIGVTAYGSTEAGGLCHARIVRPDDTDFPAEGATNMAGRHRQDVEYRIADDGEILIRERRPQVLFSGYLRDGDVIPQIDDEGWFHTGDRGRQDEAGNLVFIERMSESIRVNGEYVPIEFVEERLRRVQSLGDFALWRKESQARGHDVVLYTTSTDVRESELRGVLADLPKFMHPSSLVRIGRLPLDSGVGKVQRRLLPELPELSVVELQ